MNSLKEAKKIALESLPDETMKVKNMDELQLFVRRAYSAKPLKMPVLLVTGTSSIFCSLSLGIRLELNFVTDLLGDL